MIRNIIFDAGRVLVTDVPLKKIAHELSLKFPISPEKLHSHLYPTEHWTRLTLGEISEDQYWESFLKASKLDLDKGYLKDKVRAELRPIPDNVKIIPRLAGKYRLAILSNHAREWTEYMQKEFDFFGYFDQVIFSCDVHLRKPDRRIYELALRQLGSGPQRCLFVDDKKRNTDGAEAVGMKTIVLENASHLLDELLQAGVTPDG
jgi:epoxide hydrolase-like predicted phosphatase